MDVQIVETLHGAPEAKLGAFADAADLFLITKGENQGPASEAVSDVNRRATVAELNQVTSASFEHQRLAGVTVECGLLVLVELAVERDGG